MCVHPEALVLTSVYTPDESYVWPLTAQVYESHAVIVVVLLVLLLIVRSNISVLSHPFISVNTTVSIVLEL